MSTVDFDCFETPNQNPFKKDSLFWVLGLFYFRRKRKIEDKNGLIFIKSKNYHQIFPEI